jgi:uncharacterized protein Usg
MEYKKGSFEKQLVDGYSLTTAEIIYHMPDMPHLLQSYVWQDYDLAPRYPVLNEFIEFWIKELDGPLHSIILAEHKLISASDLHYYTGEFTIQ